MFSDLRPMLVVSCLAAMFLAGLLAGCASTDEQVRAARVEHTPLDLDPMHDDKLAVWWSNGLEVLRLDPVGSFAFYDQGNPYRHPASRGQWSRENYAEIMLARYDAIESEWIRTRLARDDFGEIFLMVPGFDPMKSLPGRPTVAEDAIVGAWSSDGGTITLHTTGRYSYQPGRASGDPSIIAVGHEGYWRLDQPRLRLRPDTPHLGPYELQIVERGAQTVIIGMHATYVRTAVSRNLDD